MVQWVRILRKKDKLAGLSLVDFLSFLLQYTVSGRDRNKGVLMLKVSFVQIGPKLLIDFRLSRGDGLEFKRIFAILRQKLYSLIDDDPAPWTAAPQSDAHENQLYSSAGFGPSM